MARTEASRRVPRAQSTQESGQQEDGLPTHFDNDEEELSSTGLGKGTHLCVRNSPVPDTSPCGSGNQAARRWSS